jgi:hypothetical protein
MDSHPHWRSPDGVAPCCTETRVAQMVPRRRRVRERIRSRRLHFAPTNVAPTTNTSRRPPPHTDLASRTERRYPSCQ